MVNFSVFWQNNAEKTDGFFAVRLKEKTPKIIKIKKHKLVDDVSAYFVPSSDPKENKKTKNQAEFSPKNLKKAAEFKLPGVASISVCVRVRCFLPAL